MYAPLYENLIKYSQHKKPFHMPGHKFGRFGNMKELDLTALDATEASGLDNLYEAEGIIKQAMDELSRFYGAKETIMLTNGSTAGILASILAVCKEGDQLLVARNCHHSVWHGLILGGIQPIYINPQYDEDNGLVTSIEPSQVEQVLAKYPKIKGMIMVSPTYEGITSDIVAIAEILHQEDKALIVDEAHGAHFVLDATFPMSAVQLGADIVIQSMHKTLPTLTQSALLHTGTHRIKKEKLIKSLRMIQTSSPSYMMMATMDYMRGYIEEHIEKIREGYIQPLKEVRDKLKSLKHLKLIENTKMPYDISKIIISTQYASFNGYDLAEQLERDYNIVSEASSVQYIILMTMVADDTYMLNTLAEALLMIDSQLQKAQENQEEDPYKIFEQHKESRGITPRKAYYGEHVVMPIKHCEGRISVESIMMYPPGVPIVCIGEVMTREHIELIKQWKHKLQGITIENDEIICKVLEAELE